MKRTLLLISLLFAAEAFANMTHYLAPGKPKLSLLEGEPPIFNESGLVISRPLAQRKLREVFERTRLASDFKNDINRELDAVASNIALGNLSGMALWNRLAFRAYQSVLVAFKLSSIVKNAVLRTPDYKEVDTLIKKLDEAKFQSEIVTISDAQYDLLKATARK